MRSQEPPLMGAGGQSLCHLFGLYQSGWRHYQQSGAWLASGASDDPSLAVGQQFSLSSCLAYAWGMAHGRRQESPSLLPTPSQGPQNTFEQRLGPGSRERRLPTISCPHKVTGSRPLLAGWGPMPRLPASQALWVSLTCSQATPEEGHQPGRQWSGPWVSSVTKLPGDLRQTFLWPL